MNGSVFNNIPKRSTLGFILKIAPNCFNKFYYAVLIQERENIVEDEQSSKQLPGFNYRQSFVEPGFLVFGRNEQATTSRLNVLATLRGHGDRFSLEKGASSAE